MPMTDATATKPPGLWRRLTRLYAELLSWLLAITVGLLIIPVSLQIFSRYTELIPSYIWTEEMARFLFIWSIMFGAMLGIREGTHFEVDIWPQLGARGAAALRIVSGIAVLGLALVFLWFGIEFTRFAWNRFSELAELPLWLIHIAWPVAGLTWIVFLGEQFVDELKVLFGGEA
jgi:TRAP-type transport system small permease protein